MSLNGHPQNRRCEAVWSQALLAFAALFAVIIIRSAPSDFPEPPAFHHSSVSAVSSHDQRPRFDFEGLQWSAPLSLFLPFPPAAESAHLTPATQLWSALQTKGFHYNRPPPAS